MTSAPSRLTASCASSVLPSDFDILRPLSSRVRPWLMTFLKGADSRVATAHTSDELNHPRACSTASRYASAGQRRSGRNPRTAACELPESNHTSRMSSPLLNDVAPHLGHFISGAAKSPARDAPVRARLGHVADAIARPRGRPNDGIDFRHHLFAQALMIDVDEPLLGGEKNHRIVASPAMRIAVRVHLAMQQRADFLQV